MIESVIALGLGALVGTVMALTGAGGGVLAVPLLVLVLHRDVQQAAPVALLAVGAAAWIGAALGLREGIVRYRAAGLIGAVAMVMAPVGVAVAHHVPQTPLLVAFAVVLVWVAWRMGRSAGADDALLAERTAVKPCQVDPARGRLRWTRPCAGALAGTGLVSGLLTGALGVGGGFVVVPTLSRITNLDLRSIAATSLAVMALATTTAFVAALGHGRVEAALALPFGLAAVGALLLGRRWARRWEATTLQRLFASVCLVVAALMILRAWQA